MANEANRPVKALLTMHRIVEALDDAGRVGVTEIADNLGRPRSVVHDYLSTLVQLEYVVKVDEEYELSLRYLELGGHVRDQIPLYEVAKPEIRRLADESSSELVTLSVEEEGMCVAIDVVQSSQSITYNVIPGMYFHMHSSGVGKAILAHYSNDHVEAIIDRHGLPARTKNTNTDREDLYEEFEDIREDGVAYEREEYKPGMVTIAAPIEGAQNKILGGLSVSGPAHRLRERSVEEELIDKLLSAVNIIELNISAR